MRLLADLQRAPDAEVSPTIAPTLPVTRARTFDTPEFAGMTFLEVETKSALNKVNGMPFGWSINPYRGCQHACSYCLSPETPVLKADGTAVPIGSLRVGDLVYGTQRSGHYRRLVSTPVLDTWTTRKAAHRVRLANGTTIVASGDHRFLTHRGWKHVTGRMRGAGQRPYLTINNTLMGPGVCPEPPTVDADYRRGYLTGMIRGDGTLGTYRYESAERVRVVHRFRLALADLEALDRSQEYLASFGIVTDRFSFSPATSRRQALEAIRTSKAGAVQAVRDLIEWPGHRTKNWSLGFLAGLFDAEGSHLGTTIRISNGDAAILLECGRALDRIGVTWILEPGTDEHVGNIRITGGLPMRLTFLLSVGPAITRKRQIDGLAIKGSPDDTRVVAVEDVGLDLPMVDITTGTGDFIAAGVVSHNCFARPTHEYLNLSPTTDFDRTVVVKTNIAEVLRGELARPRWKGEHVAMGTNTDPYQRAEGRYRLMPDIIRALAGSWTPFSILTKGTLITRDLPVLLEAAQRVPVAASLTIGTLDRPTWRTAEPGTPSPRARLDAVRALNDAGIPTGVMVAPIMPGINDDPEQLAALATAAVAAGATHVTPIPLHLRPGVKAAFWPWLESTHPALVETYTELYGPPDAGRRGRSTLPEATVEGLLQTVRDARDAAWAERGNRPPEGSWPDRARPGEHVTGHAGSPSDTAAREPVLAEQLSII
ncbi:radical SAM protein [Euzebya rosea]|uniref:radical SAM protein n=1 Tax=Euzebya rosea TaxID=2052804 RepID=UPI000D3E9CED|nr:radical SAM protein [Euzebya rosea]